MSVEYNPDAECEAELKGILLIIVVTFSSIHIFPGGQPQIPETCFSKCRGWCFTIPSSHMHCYVVLVFFCQFNI